MKPVSKLLSAFAATLVAATTLFAKVGGVTTPASGPQTVEVGLGGLQTQLTTGGFRFVVGETAGTTALNSFPASACLQNRSPFDLKFTFPTPGDAERKFTFRIFDHDGNKVWESDSELVSAEVLTDATLGKFQRWKRTMPIPLKPGGTALPAGIYTLEASIDADKQLGATAVFEVISAPQPPDPTTTGIRGLVLKADGVAINGQPAPTESPAANALIVVNEIITANVPGHAPFNWAGHADNDGRFTTNAPAGHYRVTASYVAPAPTTGAVALVYPPKVVEVNVTAGAFTEVLIQLVPVTPPPQVQGIRGHVLIGTGAGAETALAGALLTIDQLEAPAGITPFHWQGVSGANGGFDAPTPAGSFRVTAAAPANIPTASAPVSVTVAVAAGAFSEVTLHLVATPPQVQGIRGHVLIGTGTATGTALAGALLTIDQLDTVAGSSPFHWQGVSGAAGGFEVPTPAGSFRVTASPALNTIVAAPVTVTVAVTAGAFSEVNLHLVATSTTAQGIRGRAFIGNGAGVETALAGAVVTIDQLNTVTGIPPFHWQGVANGEGRFLVATPTGHFRVVAAVASTSNATPPSATAELDVATGLITEVALHITTNAAVAP